VFQFVTILDRETICNIKAKFAYGVACGLLPPTGLVMSDFLDPNERPKSRRIEMQRSVLALVVLAALASPALAQESAKYYVVVDTVGNCSVIEGSVSTGKTAIAEKSGYDAKDAAMKALEEIAADEEHCKDVVG
jgi:hypothetical protein